MRRPKWMREFWVVLVLTGLLCLSPSVAGAAEPMPEIAARYVRPQLGDRYWMEELLLFFSMPREPGKGVFTAPPLRLSVRSHAFLFVPSRTGTPEDPWEVLALSTDNLPVTDLPGGKQLHSLLRNSDAEPPLTLGQLGPRLRAKDGPLQRWVHSTFGASLSARLAGSALMAAAMVGTIGKLGTWRAQQLGLAPTLSHRADDGAWEVAGTLHAARGFKNPAVESFVRYRLPHLSLRLFPNGEDFIEGGVTGGALGDAGAALLTRWAKLRTRSPGVELAAGVRSNHGDPFLWLEAECVVRKERLSLRSVMAHQPAGAHSRANWVAAVELPHVMLGAFAGLQRPTGWSTGLVSMGAF